MSREEGCPTLTLPQDCVLCWVDAHTRESNPDSEHRAARDAHSPLGMNRDWSAGRFECPLEDDLTLRFEVRPDGKHEGLAWPDVRGAHGAASAIAVPLRRAPHWLDPT